MQTYLFDDRNITWQTVESIGAQIYVLAVDDALGISRSEEHTSELQSHVNLVCRLLLEKKKKHKRSSTERNTPCPHQFLTNSTFMTGLNQSALQRTNARLLTPLIQCTHRTTNPMTSIPP